MTKTNEQKLKASRPGEYVAFFTMQFPILEGSGFIFLACDVYSEYGFHTGVDKDKKSR